MAKDVEGLGGKWFAMWDKGDIVDGHCPFCLAHAVVELTPRLKAKQPDGTTHVCHPGFGGCNHGFAYEEDDRV